MFNRFRNAYGGLSRSIWLLALVMLINRSGTMVIPFLTVYLTASLGFGVGEAGLVVTVFGLGSIVGTLLGGRLSDRFGYFPVMFWSLVLGGLLFFVLGQMRTLSTICATVFVLSVVAEAFRPANSASVASYATPATLTRSYALNRLAINLGWSVGPVLGGVLAGIGYGWLFVADGATCLLAAVLLWVFLKNRSSVAAKTGVDVPAALNSSVRRDRTFLIFLLFSLIFAIAFFQMITLIPVYLKEVYHFSEPRIGLWLALNGVIVAACEMVLVHGLDGRRSPLVFARWGVVMTLLAFVGLNAFEGWVPVLWIGAVLLSFGEMFSMPFMQTFSVKRASVATRGQYAAAYSAVWSGAWVLAPAIGSQVVERAGYAALWWLMCLFCAVAWLGLGWVKRREIPHRTEPVLP